MADLLDKLTDTIRSGSIGKATKRSAKWFRDKIQGLKVYYQEEQVWVIYTVIIMIQNIKQLYHTMMYFQ